LQWKNLKNIAVVNPKTRC